MKIPVNQVIVGERVREDIGDIKSLADSIAKFGLLHPIVLDDDNNLVAGGRRLEAVKLLGWENISYNNIGKLSDIKLREIELEENLRRKDLTEYEKSKDMVELAKLRTEEKKKEFRSTIERNYEEGIPCEATQNTVGRPSNPESIREMAKSIDVTPITLHNSIKHVEAVEKYPKLAEVPKMQAIETSKKLDKLPEPERDEELERINKLCEPHDKYLDFARKVTDSYTDAIFKPAGIKIDDERLSAWTKFIYDLDDIETKLIVINNGITNLTKLKEFLQNLTKLKVVEK